MTDTVSGITADSSGNIYVVGTTSSADFPTHNALQNLLQGPTSGFILKLDASGSSLVYSTFFGNNTGLTGVAADAAGDAFIVGGIGNSGADGGGSITTTPGAFQTSPKSAKSPFIAKLSQAGTLVYGTYLGGTLVDFENAIAVDATGHAYVAGRACSLDFPTTPGAYQTTLVGSCDGAVSKLSADGSALVYSTFLGTGNGLDRITLDSNGTAYVTGSMSGSSSFPLVNPIQSDVPQATLTAINSAGTDLLYSTFFGGDIFSYGVLITTKVRSLGIDGAGNVYVSGDTSIEGFPILAANNGLLDEDLRCSGSEGCLTRGFVAKISPGSGTALASPSEVNFGLQPLSTGLATQSSLFIANVGTTNIQINSVTATGDYSISSNTCSGVLLSALHCRVLVNFKPTAGGTRTGTLTITSDAPDSPRNIQLTGVGGVPQVSLSPMILALTSPSIGASGPAQTVTLRNTGQDVLNISGLTITGGSAADFSETHNCPGQLRIAGSCQINITYKASTSNTELAALQITDDAAGSPHMVNLTGVTSALGLAVAAGMPSSQTISAGRTVTYNLVVGGPGFSGSVSLSCSGAPSAASCTLPGSVTMSSTPTPFQVAVPTTARSTAATFPALQDKGRPQTMIWAIGGFVMLVILLISERRRRKLVPLACACLYAIVIASCGGSGSSGGKGTPAGAHPSAVAVGDFNGNGLPDFAVTVNDGVNVELGNGDGTFSEAGTFPLVRVLLDPIVVGDFDGDGFQDLVVGCQFSVVILRGLGDGTFRGPLSFPVWGAYFIAVGDFNSDGNLDLAVIGGAPLAPNGAVYVLLGNGDATFRQSGPFEVGAYPKSIAVGDFNGDGVQDLAVANVPHFVSVLQGKGDGTFVEAPSSRTIVPIPSPRASSTEMGC